MYGAARKKALNTLRGPSRLPSTISGGCRPRLPFSAATEIWARALAAQKHKAIFHGNYRLC